MVNGVHRQLVLLVTIVTLSATESRKTGYCPTLDPDLGSICVMNCYPNKNDTDCRDNLKCCSDGCGYSCQSPVETLQKLAAINVTVAFDIPCSTVKSSKSGFINAVTTALEHSFPQFFTFMPTQVDVTEISGAQNCEVTKVSMVINQGNQTQHDFRVHSGALKTNIRLGLFKVVFNGQTVSQVKKHSDFYYVYKNVDDTACGRNIHGMSLSMIIMALVALLYVL